MEQTAGKKRSTAPPAPENKARATTRRNSRGGRGASASYVNVRVSKRLLVADRGESERDREIEGR